MLHDKVQKFGVSKTMPVLWVVANDRTVARRKSVQENYLVRERHLSGRPASYRRDKGARYLGVEYTCAIMTTRTRKPKAKAVRKDAYKDGFQMGIRCAAEFIGQFDSQIRHPYRMEDCVLSRFNLRRARPRRKK